MSKCAHCDKPLTKDEVEECIDSCFECDWNYNIGRLSHHLKEIRISFEEVIRLLINEMDK